MRGQRSTESWQHRVFLRLRDRQWITFGALFEEFETSIPLHNAMRTAMQRTFGNEDLPTIHEARWRKFCQTVAGMGVERVPRTKSFKWNDQVRLNYLAGRECQRCLGPVVRAAWSSTVQVVCLECDRAKVAALPVQPPPVVEEVQSPVPVPVIPMPKPFAAQPIVRKLPIPAKPPVQAAPGVFQLVVKRSVHVKDRRGVMGLIRRLVYPGLTIAEIERRHRDMDTMSVVAKYRMRIWLLLDGVEGPTVTR